MYKIDHIQKKKITVCLIKVKKIRLRTYLRSCRCIWRYWSLPDCRRSSLRASTLCQGTLDGHPPRSASILSLFMRLCRGTSTVLWPIFLHFLTFFRCDVVGVSTKNVFEKALDFVDIVVSLPTEIEGFDFFVFGLVFLFFLDLFLMALFEVFDDGIIMVSVLLPEFTECISFSFLGDELTVSDFESFFFESFNDFKCENFVSRDQLWFSL